MKHFLPIEKFLNERDEQQADTSRRRLKYLRYIDDIEDEELNDSEKYNKEKQIGNRAAILHDLSPDTTNTPQ